MHNRIALLRTERNVSRKALAEAVEAAYESLDWLSGEHILHPERYLSGKRPVTLPDVEVPAGFQPSARLTFGELGTRLDSRPDHLRIVAAGRTQNWLGYLPAGLMQTATGTVTAQPGPTALLACVLLLGWCLAFVEAGWLRFRRR